MHYKNILKEIGNTPIVPINRLNPFKDVTIYAKLEACNPGGSIKDRIALSMIESAEGATTVEEQQRLVREIDMEVVKRHLLVWGPIVPYFVAVQPWVRGYNGEIELGEMDRNAIFARLWIDIDLKKDMGY